MACNRNEHAQRETLRTTREVESRPVTETDSRTYKSGRPGRRTELTGLATLPRVGTEGWVTPLSVYLAFRGGSRFPESDWR